MSIEYRLEVVGSAGLMFLESDQALFSIDEFSVAPDGDCLEATFRCVPSKLVNTLGNPSTIPLRARVRILTRPTGGTFIVRWWGFTVLAGNPFSDNVETFRAVGLKKWFYEVVLGRTATIAAQDVAAQANVVVQGLLASNNNILGFDFITLDAPTLGFTGGRYYPLLQTAGDALDALAATVGRFIVPVGETYTYDGVTFTAGELVPPVTWGVRASLSTGFFPVVFFRRTFENVAAVAETDLNAQVNWPALSGEQVNTRPVIQYFANMDWSALTNPQFRQPAALRRPLVLPVAQPMIYSSISFGQTQAVVELPNPSDFLVPQTYLSQSSSSTTGMANAFDGDSATSALITVNGAIQYQVSSIIPQNNQNLTVGQAAVRVDIEYGHDIGFNLQVGHIYGSGATSIQWQGIYVAPPSEPVPPATTSTARVKFDFPVLPPLEFLEATALVPGFSYRLIVLVRATAGAVSSAGTLKVFDMRAVAPTAVGNNTVAERLVEIYRMPIVPEAADVKLFTLGEIRTRIDLTPEVGAVLAVPVERVQYSVTTAEGVTTTYHAGQAFDGELVSERVVLEGLARRASRNNI